MSFFEGAGSRRQINLSGVSKSASSNAVLDSARTARLAREEHRRRERAAGFIQKVWRGRREARQWRTHCGKVWEATGDVRYLVGSLGGGDEERLERWCQHSQSTGLSLSGIPPDRVLVYLRVLAMRLLVLSCARPRSASAPLFLSTLATLIRTSPPIRSSSLDVARGILRYLLNRNLYRHLSEAFTRIPVTAKTEASLPYLTTLATAPFACLPPSDAAYSDAVMAFATSILTLPLLPNRLPLPALIQLSSRAPLQTLFSMSPPSISDPVVARDLLANLVTLVAPRLSSWPGAVVAGWLAWASVLMGSVGAQGFVAPPTRTEPEPTSLIAPMESDDEGDVVGTSSSQSPNLRAVSPPDPRTLTRLSALTSAPHLLTAISRTPSASLPSLYSYLLTLVHVWPERRELVIPIVARAGRGGFEREIYRLTVRGKWSAFINKSVGVRDNSLTPLWPTLLLLTELYTYSLLTMGDDEFFSEPNAPRNPFTLDELEDLSGLLLRISFSLYWSANDAMDLNVPGLPMTWEAVREKVTKLLIAIRARDSRRPFTPPDHWHMIPSSELTPFVEAAIYEESESGTRSKPISKSHMASISPRLGVLNNIPFAVPFDVRVGIFRQFVLNDLKALGLYDGFGRRPRYGAEIRRDHVAEDGYDQLNGLGPALKGPVAISFRDKWGNIEAGIDGGGVFKEFLTSLTKEAFDVNRGLWLATARQEIYPNPHSYAREPRQLNWYRFMGRILGKALYEGILVDMAFAPFFLCKWLGKRSHFDDLPSLDLELYNGLVYLKHCDSPEELSLNFTVTDSDLGVTRTIELIPNGSNTPVTKENRLRYIALVSSYRLNVQTRAQSEAFLEGLSDVVDLKWLRMFDQRELQILIGGVEEEINVDDLRDNTLYSGVYDETDETVRLFWKVVKSLDNSQRKALLRFVTSCSRPPLLGFSELYPKFCIRDATDDQTRLPTSSTCVNLLKLPRYKDELTLQQKLVTAINSNAGFDLS